MIPRESLKKIRQIEPRTKRELIAMVLLFACSGAFAYQYSVPARTNDGWEVASWAEEKLDAGPLNEMFERISDKTCGNIHSVLLIKNGKLVVEEYFPGQNSAGQIQTFTRDTLHEIHSATKSVNSVLVGIAIDQHLIHGVDEKISDFFPEYSDIFTNQDKGAIRLKDLLSMTAGLSWDESTYPYTDPRNDLAMMGSKADFFRCLLEKPVAAPPGKKFVYNSGISLMLGEIVHKASGLPADEFAERYLFSPLGITNYYWQKTPTGVVNTLGGLWMRPRDMAKIGQLFLNGGRWNGKQIVSKKWIKDSTKQQIIPQLPAWYSADGYGYQWWHCSFRVHDKSFASYSARGRGGQFIVVIPTQHLVAVFTGWNDNELLGQPLEMIQKYILPATLPANAR